MTVAATLRDELRRAIGADRVRDSGAELSLYRRDAGHMTGVASIVCFPTSTAEVASCVRIAKAAGVPFVARGSGTGLAGGAVPPDGALVVSLTKMNRIRSVDPDVRRAWVEPGVLNLDLSRAVAVHRSALRSRPEQPADVHHRRQRGEQLGRSALPRRGRDGEPHRRFGGRASRRHRDDARRRRP